MKNKLLWLLLCTLTGYSQTESYNTTNVYKLGFLFNPALSSYDSDDSFVSLGYRAQWANVYQAPRSLFASYNNRSIDRNYSYDVYLSSTSIGIFDHRGINMSYSYKIPLTNILSTSFGISLGAATSILDFSEVNDVNGNVDFSNVEEMYYFDFGIGNVTEIGNLKIGISALNLLNRHVSTNPDYGTNMTYKGYLGYRFGMTYKYRGRPSYGGKGGSILKSSRGGFSMMPIFTVSYSEDSFDYGGYLMTEMYSMVNIQVGYSDMKGINTLFGIQLENLGVYYSYDFGSNNMSKLGITSTNSHEISLVYNIFSSDNKIATKKMTDSEGISDDDVKKMIKKSEKKTKKYIDSKSGRKNKEENKRVLELEKRVKELENEKRINSNNNVTWSDSSSLIKENKNPFNVINSIESSDENINKIYLDRDFGIFVENLNSKLKDLINSKFTNYSDSDIRLEDIENYINSKIGSIVKGGDTLTIVMNPNLDDVRILNLNLEKIEFEDKNSENLNLSKSLLEKMQFLNRQIKNSFDRDDKYGKSKNKKYWTDEELKRGNYLIVGVFYREPIDVKEELVRNGFRNAGYFYDRGIQLFYLYIEYFESVSETQEYKKNTNYKGGNIWNYYKD